ncbi:protein EPIDERMAL PATTERNING FACTOR 2 [Mangifera indica]|uniref:protein EPIDERMAL PATTERNING FACTOR 2 n=1 Tax=Mangifera indica TaxID=29780 RepID=UPI001CF96365|nr:protein EPIDERMAL PATTERNING FACTOR 2 [Mangifera indica]XP_044512109.1 protein EPIDERMAL PATTERNING FACTOR 2 [Mangifera indica]
MMKLLPNGARCCLAVMMLFMSLIIGRSLRLSPHHDISATSNEKAAASTYDDHQIQNHMYPKERVREELGLEVYPTGSSLPDCSHACGPCFPCKRVMVSFKCSIAESCPIVYRCMCKGKYYHVPSN